MGQSDPVSGRVILDYRRGRIGSGTMLSECQKSARISGFFRIRFLGIYATWSLCDQKYFDTAEESNFEMVKNDQAGVKFHDQNRPNGQKWLSSNQDN